METLLQALGASGPIGIIAAIAIYVAWKKDQQIDELNAAMLTMQEKMLDRYHLAIAEVNKAVRVLHEELGSREE